VTKTRIHDLAAEFAMPTEHLLKLLAEMDIHVRSHLSALDPGQVALVRARWEREKRKSTQTATSTRRRRTTKRTTSKKAAKTEADESRPLRRRRTAAEVQAKADAEAAATAEHVEDEAPAVAPTKEAPVAKQSMAERAAALFKDSVTVEEAPAFETDETVAETAPLSEETLPVEAEAMEERPAASAPVEPVREPVERPAAERPSAPPKPKRVQRPTPVTRGIKPVASSAPGPRPVASAAPGDAAEERRRDRKKRKKGRRQSVDTAAVKANINRTMASLKGSPQKKGRRREEQPSFREREALRRAEEREREKTLVRVNEFITVSELADTLSVNSTDIVAFCFKELGMIVTVNQRLDFDQIELIASEFGYEATREEEYASQGVLEAQEEDKPEDLVPRPPVVTVMGHVDHGKTSLLDHVRKANVIAGEAGGITQHIGAYHVELEDGRVITFLDTPGHEAFTAMRARGAQATDIVVLVVAADDQVMPQTIEAISHARNAGVPMVIAINKIDLPAANVEKVKQGLLQHQVILEDFGGDTMWAAISAKTGQGVDDLLEKVLLQAEILDKKANPDRGARGTVVESTLDPGKGPVATVLVQNGSLRVGEDFICGHLAGRVRALLDERGNRVEVAGPSIPVQVLGFEGVPEAGDAFVVVENATEAREVAQKRQRLDREAAHRRSSRGVSLEDISKHLEAGEVQALNLIIKADQGGPAEALADAFAQISTSEVRVEVIHRGVGSITESDILLAKASNAIIIGFHVRPDSNARAAAEREHVDVRTYRVIYEAVEDVRAALEGMLAPEERETVTGEAEVLQTFKISGVGTVAGCIVRNGVMRRSAKVRVIRDGVDVYTGGLSSLKRFKEDVREVKDGLECGMGVENFNDVKVGDIIQAFTVEQVARSLEPAGAAKGN
jgi:translation initiation factor IF-2